MLFTPLLLVAKEYSAALGVQERALQRSLWVGPHPGCFCDWLGHISLEKLSGDWEVQLSGKAAGQWAEGLFLRGTPEAGIHSERLHGWEREVSCPRHMPSSCCQLSPMTRDQTTSFRRLQYLPWRALGVHRHRTPCPGLDSSYPGWEETLKCLCWTVLSATPWCSGCHPGL